MCTLYYQHLFSVGVDGRRSSGLACGRSNDVADPERANAERAAWRTCATISECVTQATIANDDHEVELYISLQTRPMFSVGCGRLSRRAEGSGRPRARTHPIIDRPDFPWEGSRRLSLPLTGRALLRRSRLIFSFSQSRPFASLSGALHSPA